MKSSDAIRRALWTKDKIEFFMEKIEEEAEEIKTELNREFDGTMEFTEGEEYEMAELPQSDMTASGNLEAIGDGRLAARYGDKYVTFEYHTVKCVDVKNIDEL